MIKLIAVIGSGLLFGGLIAASIVPASTRISTKITSSISNLQYRPKRLIIPVIGVNAVVEQVGTDAEGRMAAPADWNNVGWYAPGTVPGQIGQAVIDGHYDSPTGPAVFTRLDDLQYGDEVFVTDLLGRKRRFVVVDKRIYSDAEFPVNAVFGPSLEPMLNLITCQGVFDRQSQNYLSRIVIRAKLWEKT